MKIGILQTGLVPPAIVKTQGEYPQLFEKLLEGEGFTFQTFAVVKGVFPQSAEQCDGWLITGSRHGAYEDHPWIPPLEALIRDIIAADRPLIGVCFGHQIIAQALGGKVEKFAGGWAVGPQTYRFANGEKTVHAWHQDQVTRLPESAEVVAENDFCRNAALLYAGKAYTVQAHPEFEDGFIKGLIDTRGRGIVPDGLLKDAEDALGGALDRTEFAAQFAHFFRERRLP